MFERTRALRARFSTLEELATQAAGSSSRQIFLEGRGMTYASLTSRPKEIFKGIGLDREERQLITSSIQGFQKSWSSLTRFAL